MCPGSSAGLVVCRPGLDALFRPGEGLASGPSGFGGGFGGAGQLDDGVTVPEVRLRFEGIFESSAGALALSQARRLHLP